MTEPTNDGRVREVMYSPGGVREYERTISPATAFSKGICLITAALKAAGREEEADSLWDRYVTSDAEGTQDIPPLGELFGDLE